jgi:hypothetical protein
MAQLEEKTYVTGLASLTVMSSSKYKKLVYILGEIHNKEYQCPEDLLNVIPADQLFLKLLNSCPDETLLDVYLEETFNSEHEKGDRFFDTITKHNFIALSDEQSVERSHKGGYMENVLQVLYSSGCLTDSIDSCQIYKNHVRFHLADIRAPYSTKESKTPFSTYINLIFGLTTAHMYPVEYVTLNIQKLRTIGPLFDSVENVRNGLRDMIKNYRIDKQLNNIKYKQIQEFLSTLMTTYMSENEDRLVWSNIKPFVQIIEDDSTKDACLNIFITKNGTMLFITIILMDIFLISRIFRTFKDTPGKLNGEPTNIIIYAGDAHAVNYKKILKYLEFDTVFEHKNHDDTMACLDITNFKMQWADNPVNK